ncbi:hypothetical protein ACLM5H_18340 [Fredinandcohnia humi]
MILICKHCEKIVSNKVDELEDRSLLNTNKDGEDYIPKGFYTIGDGKTCPERFKDWIIINHKDLLYSKYHSDRTRLNGCCGKDGLDGNNRVCLTNHEIGTEMSDCWQVHLIALDPNLVKWL